MQRYKLSPAGFAAVRRRLLLMLTPLLALGAGLGLYSSGASDQPVVLVATAVFMLLLLGGALAFVIKQQRRVWDSFELIVDETCLVRRQAGFPELAIDRGEVRRLRETGGGLAVETGSALRVLAIPRAIERYDELRQTLGAWQPIETVAPGQARLGPLMAVGAGLLAMVAMGVVFVSQDPLLVLPAGALVVLGLIASAVVIFRSPDIVDTRTRRMSWMMVFPLLSVIAKMVFALTP